MILPIFCLVFYQMNRKTVLGSRKQGLLHWNTRYETDNIIYIYNVITL